MTGTLAPVQQWGRISPAAPRGLAQRGWISLPPPPLTRKLQLERAWERKRVLPLLVCKLKLANGISPVLSTKTKALLCAPSSCKRVNEVGLHELWRQKCVWVWNQRMCADSGVWSDPARRIHRDVEADESLSRISNLSSSAGFTKWRITEIGGSFVHRSQFPAPVSRLVQSLLRF